MISVHFGTLYCTLQVSYTFVPISVMPHYPPWPVQVKVGQGGDLTFNRANIWSRPLKSPCRLRWKITGKLTHTVYLCRIQTTLSYQIPNYRRRSNPFNGPLSPCTGTYHFKDWCKFMEDISTVSGECTSHIGLPIEFS